MPVRPAPSRWALPQPTAAPEGQELIAVGADLAPGTLLAGYCQGLFAMPDAGLLGWWSPDPRGILRPGEVHVSRSLRRAFRRFTVTRDTVFEQVVAGCGDPDRPHGWMTDDYRASYQALFQLGWAHSIEVWEGERLAGGLFGVEVGGLFAAESKFHLVRDASKVAVVALAELLAADARPDRIVDVQWCTPHLASLGAREVPRRTYLRMLARALALPPVLGGRAQPSGPGQESAARPSRITWRSP